MATQAILDNRVTPEDRAEMYKKLESSLPVYDNSVNSGAFYEQLEIKDKKSKILLNWLL